MKETNQCDLLSSLNGMEHRVSEVFICVLQRSVWGSREQEFRNSMLVRMQTHTQGTSNTLQVHMQISLANMEIGVEMDVL